VITNSKHETVELTAGRSIFLPQGVNLHSDFVKETQSLTATLVFFDDELITNYLNHTSQNNTGNTSSQEHCILDRSSSFELFFKSIDFTIKQSSYFNNKLQELLHLIAHADKSNIFLSLLSAQEILPPKKNLIRLLDTVETINLTVSDLAHLSGRSLSTFNREFKATYNMGAKQWLLEKRLSRAKELLESDKYSVTDVAMIVGYSNVSHFIKAFKNRYDLTPKAAKSNGMT
jgi:AraC-like DNA-binding protein